MSAAEWLDVAPWSSRGLLFVHIERDGLVTQANAVGDKRELLQHAAGVLLAVWPGEWSTTAKQVLPHERAAISERLAPKRRSA